MDTELIESKTQKIDECSEAIEKAIQSANEALRECGLKLTDINVATLDTDNTVRPKGSACIIINGIGVCVIW